MSRLTWTLLPWLWLGCQEESKELPQPRNQKIEGEVQIMNGTEIPGLGEKVKKYLVERGYDVVYVGTAPELNYQQTLIALRSPKWSGIDSLKKDLRTDRVIPLENKDKMVDVTIFLGKDIKETLHDDRKTSPDGQRTH